MATLSQRRSQNIDGDLYVDASCIDCDTCRWMAPATFSRIDGQSAVHQQPDNDIDRQAALQALLACPTASIGTLTPPKDIRQIQQTFPLPVTDNIYHCGYHSEKSFAAASYLITRPEGNVLVDSPRFTRPLVKRLEAMGGIRYLYLTHRDDVADHRKFHEHFGCDRILHREEINADTADVELKLDLTDTYQLAEDLMLILVPGHTKGHTALLYKNIALFSGDHISYARDGDYLRASRQYCFYSWQEQIKSVERLQEFSFEWILPGHGRRYHSDRKTMVERLQTCVKWMQQQ